MIPPSPVEPGAGPGRITALETDPRRAGTVRIDVDEQRFASVPAELVLLEGLTVGQTLDAALRARLGVAAEQESAYRTALRALERRGFARADLARRLLRKGHARPAVEAALEQLAGIGMVDDALYAEHYVATRSARGRGPLRLTRDLIAMGVDRRVIDRALAAHRADGGETPDVPLALASKRAAQLGNLPRAAKRRRLLAYLARRGFTGSDVGAMVKRVVG
ncbi:MAG TPA: regulatory protein RecX [Gemmatimonadales bacterium]|nr:regulatory protein RecX [Gemmatimonadales bacterium]